VYKSYLNLLSPSKRRFDLFLKYQEQKIDAYIQTNQEYKKES